MKNSQLYPVSQLKEVTGQGIQAVVNNHEVKIGRASFVSAEEIETSNTAIYVTIDRSLQERSYFRIRFAQKQQRQSRS